MTPNDKFKAAWRLAGALPPNRRKQVRTELAKVASEAKRRRTAVGGDGGGLLDGVRVIRPGEPGYEAAKAEAAKNLPVDADLALANKLDGIYTAVTDEVKNVATAAADVAKEAASTVTTPLVALAVVLGLALLLKKR